MRAGKLEGQWEVNSTEFMMQALARAFASVYERLRAGSSGFERTNLFISSKIEYGFVDG